MRRCRMSSQLGRWRDKTCDMAESPNEPETDERKARHQAEMEELRAHLVGVNDAMFGLVGILCRIIVDGGLVSKDDLAAMIMTRAGRENDPDHRPTLVAFARAIRMNLPGGRFDVIEGGRSAVDSPTT